MLRHFISTIFLLSWFAEGFVFINNNYKKVTNNSHRFTKTAESDGLNDFLAGFGNKVWKGTRTILKRRGQIPDPKYGPNDVIKVITKALQFNDDPQLDNGACVVIEFKNPSGPLSTVNDPAEFGRFLRSTEGYTELIDFKESRLVGPSVAIEQGISLRQSVDIVAWGGSIKTYDFFLSKVDDLWLLDAIKKR